MSPFILKLMPFCFQPKKDVDPVPTNPINTVALKIFMFLFAVASFASFNMLFRSIT